jgi:hypothetical protein
MQQDFANAVAYGRPTRLTMHRVMHATVGKARAQPLELGRLPRSLASLEDDEATAHRRALSPA